jgi:lipoate-protein ligase A
VTAVALPVWWDPAADGPANMAADELLAEEAERRGGLVVRIYGWTTATVSLGAFQPYAEAAACGAIAGLPIVRRPSGGGAIIHGSDLTYAAAVPKSHPWGGSPQALYDAMHESMATTLGELGISARLHAATAADPPADAFLCFARRAPGDLVASPAGRAPSPIDPKIMGSAQRRLGTTVLQHGSLLLAANQTVGPAARHVGLAELVSGDSAARRESGGWAPETIVDRWLELVSKPLGIAREFQPEPFRSGREAAIDGKATRFRDPRWTGRR